jgi:hypothetical protein
LVPITGSRISSGSASKKTLQRRSQQISQARKVISGGDASSQLQAEVKLLSDYERKKLLGEIGLPVVIPTDHALAIKADLALPLTKLQVLRR